VVRKEEVLKGLEREMQKRHMTYKELSSRLGYTQQTLHRKRRGTIITTLDDLHKIAEILGCSIPDLLQANENPTESTGAVSELENIFGGGEPDAGSN